MIRLLPLLLSLAYGAAPDPNAKYESPNYQEPTRLERSAVLIGTAAKRRDDVVMVRRHLLALGYVAEKITVLVGPAATREGVKAALAKKPSLVYVVRQSADDLLAGLRGSVVIVEGAVSSAPEGVTVLAADDGSGSAAAMPEKTRGLFTNYVLEALSAGKRTAKDVFAYASAKVAERAAADHHVQKPAFYGPDKQL